METRIQARDEHVNVNDVRLHYREWGLAEAPPLVILHGLTGHAWEFDLLAEALATKHRVLVVNQRGHGASAWTESYSPELMARDIAALIDALELGRIGLIGHSMGGVNGWWLAARAPGMIERLAILDIHPEVITSKQFAVGWTEVLNNYARAQYDDPEAAVREYLAGYTGAHYQEQRTFVLNNLEQGVDGRWTWRFDGRGLVDWVERAAADEQGHWSALREIACPTLVVRAAASSFTDLEAAEGVAEAIPRARLVEIADAGHDVHIDQRAALLDELRRFLR